MAGDTPQFCHCPRTDVLNKSNLDFPRHLCPWLSIGVLDYSIVTTRESKFNPRMNAFIPLVTCFSGTFDPALLPDTLWPPLLGDCPLHKGTNKSNNDKSIKWSDSLILIRHRLHSQLVQDFSGHPIHGNSSQATNSVPTTEMLATESVTEEVNTFHVEHSMPRGLGDPSRDSQPHGTAACETVHGKC